MDFIKKEWFKIGALLIGAAFLVVFYLNYQAQNTPSASDLLLKCQEIYNVKHKSVEAARYGTDVDGASAVIWSPKTKSCLGYYNVPKQMKENLFEVWDYSNTDLVLSYYSYPTKDCTFNNVVFNRDNFVYKLNPNLDAEGCFMDLQKKNIDLITNFETAMTELGFKE